MKNWILGGGAAVGVLIVAVLWWNLRARRRPGGTEAAPLDRLVLGTFGDDWAERLGLDRREVDAAVSGGTDPAVARSLHELVGEVGVRFDRRPGTTTVDSNLTCAYAADRVTASAEVPMDWDDAPADVRGEFLRDGAVTVTRRWTVPIR